MGVSVLDTLSQYWDNYSL